MIVVLLWLVTGWPVHVAGSGESRWQRSHAYAVELARYAAVRDALAACLKLGGKKVESVDYAPSECVVRTEGESSRERCAVSVVASCYQEGP